MVGVAGLRSEGLEFKPLVAVEFTPDKVDSDCQPSEVGKMSTSVQVTGALHQRHSHAPRKCWLPKPAADWASPFVEGPSLAHLDSYPPARPSSVA